MNKFEFEERGPSVVAQAGTMAVFLILNKHVHFCLLLHNAFLLYSAQFETLKPHMQNVGRSGVLAVTERR